MVLHVMNFFLLLIIFDSALSVQVILEGGNPGQFEKDIQTDQTNVALVCDPRNGNGVVSWTYQKSENAGTESTIVEDGVLKSDYADMFSLQVNNLNFLSVTTSSGGIYTCRIVPESGDTGIGDYIITVLVPPSEPKCGFPGDHAITVGHETQFTCSSQGQPNPTYVWYKNGLELAKTSQNAAANISYDAVTGVLTFKKVATTDSGSYHCEANSRAGTNRCAAVEIRTKDQDVGAIVGIVFGCIFGVLLIAVIVFWTCRKGYCDGFVNRDEDEDMDGDDANDVMLDSTGPTVNKPPSVVNGVTDKVLLNPC